MDKDLIRTLIRDVIAEEVKAMKAGNSSSAPAATVTRIANDADLASFAREVLHLAEDPQVKAAILAGRHPFRLSGAAPVAAGSIAPTSGQSHRIDKGVVTEAVIARLGKGTTRLLLGPGVSITPLARDKAKALHISVERIGK